jgi:DNA-binding response OmpR family regulator
MDGRRRRAAQGASHSSISKLRQKIERDSQNPELVLTVRRVGYRFAEDAT